jgi:hypothetical protein
LVYRGEANGAWVGAISLGWRPDGKRIRRKVTGRTKTEVRYKLEKLQAETDAGLKTSASYTDQPVRSRAAAALAGAAGQPVPGLRDTTGLTVTPARSRLWCRRMSGRYRGRLAQLG